MVPRVILTAEGQLGALINSALNFGALRQSGLRFCGAGLDEMRFKRPSFLLDIPVYACNSLIVRIFQELA
ncbi:hypothetical protein CHH28_05125 [Bacterioplanes sanyensis]|uniref:Uncharacterized protein n=1 Tax=Bacterioplanes sanyensis TaxID=1249553 RepID=A0A222FI57_9GAMM|nr:hypothetical protein CHH28_05125 [Bacterioplanes sanyensis]